MRAEYEARLLAAQRETQKYMRLLDDERRANKETVAQYVKAKALLQERDERIRALGEELKKRDQTICLMKLQNKTRKAKVVHDGYCEEAQQACIEALFDIQQLVDQSAKCM